MVAGSETTGSGTRDGRATGMPSTGGRNTEYRPPSAAVLYSISDSCATRTPQLGYLDGACRGNLKDDGGGGDGDGDARSMWRIDRAEQHPVCSMPDPEPDPT